jgi:hypothetical protein
VEVAAFKERFKERELPGVPEAEARLSEGP